MRRKGERDANLGIGGFRGKSAFEKAEAFKDCRVRIQ